MVGLSASASVRPPPPLSAFERRLLWTVVASVTVVVGAGTYLHYWQPAVLRVPPEPTPDYLAAAMMDLLNVVMAVIVARHCRRHFGAYAAILFVAGSFLFTGAMENLMVLGGRFELLPFGTYHFERQGLAWFVEVPVAVCLGWFTVAYGSFFIVRVLWPGRRELWSAAVASFLCMDLDLWADPVMANPINRGWIWDVDAGSTTTLFSIPLFNFLGWFGVIFLFELLWVYARGWQARLGMAAATRRFLLGVVLAVVTYVLVIVGVELGIRALLPPIDLAFGGAS